MNEYKLKLEKNALKDLDKIPDNDLNEILSRFNDIKTNPRYPGSKKLSGKERIYRIRQGKYRIVYIGDDENKTVQIMLVRQRKDVYRNLN